MRLPLVFVLLGALVCASSAQLFPPVPTKGTVYDGARLMTPDEADSISELSREYQRSTGAPIVVATLPSLESVGAKSMGIEKYSTALFGQWRIGSRERNEGILLVVAKADRKARVELGKDWRHDYDAQAQRVLGETILPLFKRGQYAEGIRQGCMGLAQIAQRPPGANSGPAGPSMEPVPFGPDPNLVDPAPHAPSSGFPLEGLLCLVAPILLIVLIVVAIRKRSRGGHDDRHDPRNGYDEGPGDAGGFVAGVAAGQMMSQPIYDPMPYDVGGGFDPGSVSDPGYGFDSGGSDSGSFDSGSSDGGGASGDW